MKNLVLSVVLLITSVGFAQDVTFGVHGGLNLSNGDYELPNGSSSISFDTDSRVSFYVGGFAELSLNNSAHKLQTGLTYLGNGLKLSGGGGESTLKISQINLPLLFKYSVAEGLYVNVGGYIGAIISAEDEFESGGVTETNSITEGFKTIDLGLAVGAEYHITPNIFVEARYNFGLVDIIDDPNESLKNRFFNFGLGYKF